VTVLAKTLLIIALTYVAALAAAYAGQRRLMYFPDRQRITPATVGLPNVVETLVPAPDGAAVVTWYVAARPGKPTILYFHGNAGSLADRQPRIARFMGEGWGVMMMTYRGYGGSTGSPTEIDNVGDAKRTYDALRARGVTAGSIVLYGESLGSGVALQVAADRPVGGLILDAPFTSVVDVAASRYWMFPVRQLLSDRYESIAHIKRVRVPLLILHGERDRVIPVAMGRALFAAANEPKHIVTFPEGRHSDLYTDGNNALAAVRTWIGQLVLTP